MKNNTTLFLLAGVGLLMLMGKKRTIKDKPELFPDVITYGPWAEGYSGPEVEPGPWNVGAEYEYSPQQGYWTPTFEF